MGGLSACCCPCVPNWGGPPIVINVPPPPEGNVNPQDDANVVAIKARGGTVKHENNNPKGPVIEIDLAGRNLNDADLGKLLGPFPDVRKLRLANNSVNGAAFNELGNLPRLEELDLANCPFNDEGVKAIAALDQLKVLNLTNTKVSNVGMSEVAKLKQLRELRISPDVSDPGINALKDHDKLEVLIFANARNITENCVPALRSLQSLREITFTGMAPATKTKIRNALGKTVK
jgi:Leucine Rich repeat